MCTKDGPTPGVLVVGTYRDTDVARGHALSAVLADLRRMPAVTRVAVGGMDADEVRELVELIGGNVLHEGRIDEVLPQLALHWAEAVAGGDPTVAIEYAVRAGDQADGRLAYEEAAVHYRTALDLLDGADGDEVAQGRILARLAGVQQRAGDNDYAATVRRAARAALDVVDVGTAVEALTLTIRVSVTVGAYPDPEKIELLDRALRALGDDDVAPRAQLLGQLGLELLITGEIDRRSAVLDELETLLPSVPDPRLRARVARGVGLERVGVAYDREFILERQRWIRDGFAHESNPFELAALHSMDFFLSNGLGDRAGADAALAFLVQHREGSAFHSMYAYVLENMAAMIVGRLDDAERATGAWEALALGLGSPSLNVYRAVQAFTRLRERGGLAEIADLYLAFLGDGARSTAAGALSSYALITAGREVDAEALLVDFEPSRVPEDSAWAISMALWAEVVARLGSSDTCAELLRLLESNRRDHFLTGGMYCGAVNRVVALLEDRRGDHAAADEAFAAAVEDHTRMQSPPWVARTHLDWAESLLARGETDRAAAQLDAAEAALGTLDLPESRTRLVTLRSGR